MTNYAQRLRELAVDLQNDADANEWKAVNIDKCARDDGRTMNRNELMLAWKWRGQANGLENAARRVRMLAYAMEAEARNDV